jgi:hypothetical protein
VKLIIPLLFPQFLCPLIDDRFIFSVAIILFTTYLFVYFYPDMTSGYYCPQCKSSKILVHNDHIECLECNLRFSIEDLESDIEDEDLISEEGKAGYLDAFKDDFRDGEAMRDFVDSLSEDMLDEED